MRVWLILASLPAVTTYPHCRYTTQHRSAVANLRPSQDVLLSLPSDTKNASRLTLRTTAEYLLTRRSGLAYLSFFRCSLYEGKRRAPSPRMG
jgi:hypothetical protein